MQAEEHHLYTGFSMKRVFRPGETLTSRPIAFEEVRCGDVICFARGDTRIVHRAVRRLPDRVITWGDNNPAPDPDRIAAGDELYLITGVWRGGRRRPVPRGRCGMLLFYRNRLRRRLRAAAAALLRPLLNGAPLRWFGPRPESLSRVRFADNEFLYRNGRWFARRNRRGRWVLRSPWLRLCCRPADLERAFPPQS